MKIKTIVQEVVIPEGVTITYEDFMVKGKGPKGECQKLLRDPKIEIVVDSAKVTIKCENEATKREKAKIFTFKAHINNIIRGVTEGFVYTMKICSGHFPMNVTLKNGVFTVKNFLGEKIPRVLNVKDGANVKIDGNDITIESNDKEIAGQVAADIEQLCRITNRDRRIFQDGIYITNKAGKGV